MLNKKTQKTKFKIKNKDKLFGKKIASEFHLFHFGEHIHSIIKYAAGIILFKLISVHRKLPGEIKVFYYNPEKLFSNIKLLFFSIKK